MRLTAFVLATLAIASFVVLDRFRPEVLLIGNVTVDVVNGNRTVGGAVSMAAALLEARGKRACVVTTAGVEADLSIFGNHDLYVVPDKETLTFVHTYTWWGHRRVLHVTARPSITLDLEHVPFRCRLAKTVLVMPLIPSDVNSPAFLEWRNYQNLFLPQKIGLAAQGLQRDIDTDGKVFAYKSPHPTLMKSLGEGVSVFLSDVESDPWSEEELTEIVSSCDRLLITKGDKGAEEFVSVHSRRDVEAAKVANVIDTNGAGDTFATAYMLGLSSNVEDPAWVASQAAARVVTKPQSCKPWCIATDAFLSSLIEVRRRNFNSGWTGIPSSSNWVKAATWSWFVAPSTINDAADT